MTWWSRENPSPNKDIYISKKEKGAYSVQLIGRKLGINPENNPYLKYAAIFYSLLSGHDIDSELISISYSIQQDIEAIHKGRLDCGIYRFQRK